MDVASADANERRTLLVSWFQREGRHDLPWRQTRDRWTVLVSEICLQQTQVDRALPFIVRILNRFPTPEHMARAPLSELLRLWQGLGYPRRARNLHAASQILTDNGWPRDYTQLPGVGPYTADALRCFADEEPVVPADINTRRVGARLFADVSMPSSSDDAWAFGQAVMELGQRHCRARPACPSCPMNDVCPSAGTTRVIASPRQKPYAGSMRERRGSILRRLSDHDAVPRGTDEEAEQTLINDELIIVTGDYLKLAD